MLHFAGVLLSGGGIDAHGDQAGFQDIVRVGSLFCRFPSSFRQADPFVRIHGQIAALAQVLHGFADAGLGHMEQ